MTQGHMSYKTILQVIDWQHYETLSWDGQSCHRWNTGKDRGEGGALLSESNMFVLPGGQKRGEEKRRWLWKERQFIKEMNSDGYVGRKASDGIRKEKWPNICEIKPHDVLFLLLISQFYSIKKIWLVFISFGVQCVQPNPGQRSMCAKQPCRTCKSLPCAHLSPQVCSVCSWKRMKQIPRGSRMLPNVAQLWSVPLLAFADTTENLPLFISLMWADMLLASSS